MILLVLRGRTSAPDAYDEILSARRSAGFSPRISHTVSGSAPRRAFVAAGLGVGLEIYANARMSRDDVRFVAPRGHPLNATIEAAWKVGPRDARRDVVLRAARMVTRPTT